MIKIGSIIDLYHNKVVLSGSRVTKCYMDHYLRLCYYSNYKMSNSKLKSNHEGSYAHFFKFLK